MRTGGNMRVLVTGGAGFIGTAICRKLVDEQGALVINVDKLTYASIQQSIDSFRGNPSYVFEHVDICDRAALDTVFERHRPTAVLHLAAESHVDRSIDAPTSFINTNVLGTYTLLEAAAAYRARLSPPACTKFRFVHVSTDEVYGSLGAKGRFREDTPYAPSSPYSASKAASDHLAHAWCKTFGLPVIISHCSNNYGPYQFPEKLIPLMILNGLDGISLPIYGTGANVRDWLHVDDHARGLIALISEGAVNEAYNFGGGNELTNLSVAELVCDTLDRLVPTTVPRRSLITFVTDRPGHDLRYAIDASKAQRDLGWRPMRPFADGLLETVEWYLANRSWWGPLRKQVYAGERLGLR
jgi:dTDP-glucose 4,6-dehydratase